MTTNAIVETNAIESAVIGGDLSKLTPEQRIGYYNAVCKSLGLNPLTKPFDYIILNGKMTLYARKDAADQLRKLNSISIDKPDIQFQDDWIIVSVVAYDKTGRKDSDVGVVSRKDMRGDFGNALMKAVTKAKRRVTLSICGLGMLDETEIETIPDARRPAIVDIPTEQLEPPTQEPTDPFEEMQVANPYSGLPEAIREMTDSDGVKYIYLPTDKLSFKANSLIKSLKENHLSDEEKSQKSDKLAAVRAILALRAG